MTTSIGRGFLAVNKNDNRDYFENLQRIADKFNAHIDNCENEIEETETLLANLETKLSACNKEQQSLSGL